jgi:hypothetical protein
MSDTAGSRSDGFVDQLLLEAGLDDDGQLHPALLQLRALGAVTPEPSAEVAALMQRAEAVAASSSAATPAAAPPAAPLDELAARRRAKRRVTLTALSVAVSLSAGGAVAAASNQGFRDSFIQFNHAVTSFVTGSAGVPAGHHADEPAAPLPASPAAPATEETLPAAPGPAGQLVEVPPSNAPAPPETAAGQDAAPGKPAGLPAAEDLATAVPDDLTNGVGQPPQVPVPGASELPLPGTLPAVPLR